MLLRMAVAGAVHQAWSSGWVKDLLLRTAVIGSTAVQDARPLPADERRKVRTDGRAVITAVAVSVAVAVVAAEMWLVVPADDLREWLATTEALVMWEAAGCVVAEAAVAVAAALVAFCSWAAQCR